MAAKRFWLDLAKRAGLKLSDKLLVGNSDTGSSEYCDVSDLKGLIVPTSLKNPNALTFSGAATGSYDGSAAKTVNIPLAQKGDKGDPGAPGAQGAPGAPGDDAEWREPFAPPLPRKLSDGNFRKLGDGSLLFT